MNLFILDYDLDLSAQYHVDRHVVKMILEASQLLCSAHWATSTLGFAPRKLTSLELAQCKSAVTDEFYGFTHPNHPCAIWTRSSADNFAWTYCYAEALNQEYNYRYGKSHKSMTVISKLPVPNMPSGLTPFAQAMPDQYKHKDAVTAYRNYYAADKSHLFNWKHRPRPYWLEDQRVPVSTSS